jgi:Ca2+-binding EF-hand superfamily protein
MMSGITTQFGKGGRMKMMFRFSLVAVICLFMFTGAGIVRAQSLHDTADANKDGTVNKSELKKALGDRYKTEDADKDGKLTVDEYLQARQQNFNAADTNKNGMVTVEEWVIYWCGKAGDASKMKAPVKMDRQASRFQRMDVDQDGTVQQNECVVFWAGRFVDLDENKDGKMTREEYISRMKAMAEIMDLDGDGVITVEEYTISWIGKEQAAGKKETPAAGTSPAKK